jgi:hypothetical protein
VAGPLDAELAFAGKLDVPDIIFHKTFILCKIDAIILPDEFTASNTRWLAGGAIHSPGRNSLLISAKIYQRPPCTAPSRFLFSRRCEPISPPLKRGAYYTRMPYQASNCPTRLLFFSRYKSG